MIEKTNIMESIEARKLTNNRVEGRKNFLGNIISYLNSSLFHGNDTTADVLIHCSNGIIPTHRLVLASISKMLLTIFKQDTWDEPILIKIPDVTIEEMLECLGDLYDGKKNKADEQIKLLLGIDQDNHFNVAFEAEVSKYRKIAPKRNNKENASLLKPKDEDILVDVEVKLEEFGNDEADNFLESSDYQINKFDENKDIKNEEAFSNTVDVKDFDVSIHDPYESEETKFNVMEKRETEGKSRVKYSEARQYFTEDPEDNGHSNCNLCQLKIVNKAKVMRVHLMYKHKDIYLTLKQFNGPDQSQKKLGQYYSEIPNDPSKVNCNLCSSAITKRNIFRHIQNKHKIYEDGEMPAQLLCSFCGKVFRDKWNRDLHEDAIHRKIFRYSCSICGKGLLNNQKLKEHMLRHNAEKPYQCSDCGSQFTSEQGLKLHLSKQSCKMDNGRIALSSLKSDTCQKEFSSIPKLKLHYMRSSLCSHGDELKPFPCTECDKRFNTAKYLENHMRSHTGETPFQCEKCSKRFKFSNRLKYHNCIP